MKPRSTWASVLVVLLLGSSSYADEAQNTQNNNWNLKISDPGREGKFLNIPLHYGDWVPLGQAKALVENIASKLSGSAGAAPVDSVDAADERADHGELHFALPRPNPQQQPNFRRQDNLPFRFPGQQQQGYPNQQQQAYPNQQQQQAYPNQQQQQAYPQQGFQNQFQQGNRGNRKLPGNNINNQFKINPFQPSTQQNNNKAPSFLPTFNSLQSFNPFLNFFDPSEGKKPVPVPTQRPVQPQPVPETPAYPQTFNAIQTIPAPDLSNFGPPIIELDSKDGQIVVGQTFNGAGADRDHLAGFVSLDFDGFTSGEPEDKKNSKNKLSLIVGGNQNFEADFESGLVNLLNSDKESPPAFYVNSDKVTPTGFTKLDIPFMDPTEHKGALPKVFIAPIGKPIPKGYKGRPLPSEQLDKETNTENIILFDTTATTARPSNNFADRLPGSAPTPGYLDETTSTTNTPVPALRNYKFKPQKERPSLSQFYLKNKKNLEKLEELDEQSKKNEKLDKYEKFYPKNRLTADSVQKETTKDGAATTVPATTTFLPAEHRQTSPPAFNYEETTSSAEEGEQVTTVTAAVLGAEEDPVSLVYLPPLVQSTSEQLPSLVQPTPEQLPPLVQSTQEQLPPLVQSTFEQEQQDATSTFALETTSTTTAETTTPTTTRDTTTLELSTTTTSTSVETTTVSTTVPVTTTPVSTETTSWTLLKTTQDPLVRLEALRKQAQQKAKNEYYTGDLLAGDEVDSEQLHEHTTRPQFGLGKPLKGQLRVRKVNGFGPVNGTDTIKKFGKRVRSRVRPALLNNKFGGGEETDGSVEPTLRPENFRIRLSSTEPSTTLAAVKTEEYKKKFRPFFDKLYSKITKTEEPTKEEEEHSERFEVPRKRSTTPNPPLTVDAEIYEVHPETRLRITTRVPSASSTVTIPPATTYFSVDPSDATTQLPERTTVEPDLPETTLTPSEEILEDLEFSSTIVPATVEPAKPFLVAELSPATWSPQVHETADKHDVTAVPEYLVSLSTQDLQSADERREELEVFDQDLPDPIQINLDVHNGIVDQAVEESRNAWSNSEILPETTVSSRLTNYRKTIDTSKYGEDTEFVASERFDTVNEHGQQIVEAVGDQVFDIGRDDSSLLGGPKLSYTEINRSSGNQAVAVAAEAAAELEIAETGDYSEPDILYDDNKVGFNDEVVRNVYAIPVSASLNLPETTTVKDILTTTFREVPTTTVREIPTTTVKETPTTTFKVIPVTITVVPDATTLLQQTPELTTPQFNNQETTFGYDVGEIYLGNQGSPYPAQPAPEAEYQVININQENKEVGPPDSPHKIPTNLWSVFEKSREVNEGDTEQTSEDAGVTEDVSANAAEETITEGFNVASIMSYATPEAQDGPGHFVEDLPKPTEHESEVLVIDRLNPGLVEDDLLDSDRKVPKSFDFNLPDVQILEQGEIKINNFGEEQIVPLRNSEAGLNTREQDDLVKKREEWIKNWVSRKYNKPKFPRTPVAPLVTLAETTTQGEVEDDTDVSNRVNVASFAPTDVHPQTDSPLQSKPPRLTVNLDLSTKEGSEEKLGNDHKSLLYDKYSRNKLKNSLFSKKDPAKAKEPVDHLEPLGPPLPVFHTQSNGVPLGANTEILRNYGGDQLSQAEFERKILGVSTATEVSVKSMICVKGQCFDAGNVG